MKIKDLKKGEYFKTINAKGVVSACVYVRGEYDRSSRRYSACKFEDFNAERFFKPDQEVTTDFEF